MAAPQLTEPRNMPPDPGLAGSTLRQVVRATIGGRRVRVRLSNEFGTSPLSITSAGLARSAGGSAIVPATHARLTFRGAVTVAIPPGEVAVSDPIDFPVAPFADLAVTIAFGSVSADVTGHPGSRATSYLQSGNQDTSLALPEATKTEHWYILAGVEVVARSANAAVVVLGNSITDGRGSGTDRNTRWPDYLARRLAADRRTAHVAVLNAGIGGNAVVRGGLGPTALARLDRDVLGQPRARWLIVLEGVNDIGSARPEAAAGVARELIGAYEQIIARARATRLRVYGATLLPFGGSFYDDPAREAARQTVNQWIRDSNAYDAVIDFDAAIRDPASPHRLRPDADGGDHLHPNEAGYRLMAEAIDLTLFLR